MTFIICAFFGIVFLTILGIAMQYYEISRTIRQDNEDDEIDTGADY